MHDAARALLMTSVAGLSTVLGALIVFFPNARSDKMVTIGFGSAAGIMISVSLLDLYPGAREKLAATLGDTYAVLTAVGFVIVGMIAGSLIDRFVPHLSLEEAHAEKKHYDTMRVGRVSMIALTLHNFPEGIATFAAGYDNVKLGLSLALAIALHNIPEGLSVAMPVYVASGSRSRAIKYAFVSGIAEPLGATITYLVLLPFISDLLLGCTFAFAAGIMLYISFEELIPSAWQYGFKSAALYSVLTGVLIMPLVKILM